MFDTRHDKPHMGGEDKIMLKGQQCITQPHAIPSFQRWHLQTSEIRGHLRNVQGKNEFLFWVKFEVLLLEMCPDFRNLNLQMVPSRCPFHDVPLYLKVFLFVLHHVGIYSWPHWCVTWSSPVCNL